MSASVPLCHVRLQEVEEEEEEEGQRRGGRRKAATSSVYRYEREMEGEAQGSPCRWALQYWAGPGRASTSCSCLPLTPCRVNPAATLRSAELVVCNTRTASQCACLPRLSLHLRSGSIGLAHGSPPRLPACLPLQPPTWPACARRWQRCWPRGAARWCCWTRPTRARLTSRTCGRWGRCAAGCSGVAQWPGSQLGQARGLGHGPHPDKQQAGPTPPGTAPARLCCPLSRAQ